MDLFVLDDVPLSIDLDGLAQRLRLSEGSDDIQELSELVLAAQAVARPKAMYKVAFITDRDDRSVVIDGIRFESRILSVNLAKAHRVFVHVATCGTELEAWAKSLDDLLHQYWAEQIQVAALRCASRALMADLTERFQPGKTSAMAPGSLGEWPLAQQRPLFACLGEVTETIGVRLTESLLMVPAKSVSGIRFPTEESFVSCQLCPRQDCPGRRAPYDAQLYDRKYRTESEAG
jgi:hypothetical protein